MMKLSPPVFLIALLIVGCGQAKKADQAQKPTPPEKIAQKPSKPALTKLQIKDVKIGDNRNQGVLIKGDTTVQNGDMVTIEYTGKFGDGKVFDSNTPTKGEVRYPLTFNIGNQQVVPGMEKGMLGMKVGGIRELSIPAALGYGNRQFGPIPPNSDLYFTVKLLDNVKLGHEGDYDISDVKQGTGKSAGGGDTVTVKYVGKLSDGQVFETREHTFTIGVGDVVPGFDAGVTGMRLGGDRNFRIPPAIAYGTKDIKGIPPNSTLYFNVKLLKIS